MLVNLISSVVSCFNYEPVAAHQLTEIAFEFFEISIFRENEKHGCFIFVILSHHKVEAGLNLDVIKKISSIICEISNLIEPSKQHQHIKTGQCDFFLPKLTFSGIFKPVCHNNVLRLNLPVRLIQSDQGSCTVPKTIIGTQSKNIFQPAAF